MTENSQSTLAGRFRIRLLIFDGATVEHNINKTEVQTTLISLVVVEEPVLSLLPPRVVVEDTIVFVRHQEKGVRIA